MSKLTYEVLNIVAFMLTCFLLAADKLVEMSKLTDELLNVVASESTFLIPFACLFEFCKDVIKSSHGTSFWIDIE